MKNIFNTLEIDNDGVRTIAGGGTGAASAQEALLALGAIGKNSEDTTPVDVIRVLTQDEYNDLESYDATTLYFIK
jgi:hypothetical protein